LRRRPTSWVVHVFDSLSLGATGASLVHPRNGVDGDGCGGGRTEAACEMKRGCVCEDEQEGRTRRTCGRSEWSKMRFPSCSALATPSFLTRLTLSWSLSPPYSNEISPSAAPQILWLKILVQALSANAPSVCRLEKPLTRLCWEGVLLYIGLIEAWFRTFPCFLFVLDLSLSIPVFHPLPQPSPHLPLPLRLCAHCRTLSYYTVKCLSSLAMLPSSLSPRGSVAGRTALTFPFPLFLLYWTFT
jgi:hypothetical protein